MTQSISSIASAAGRAVMHEAPRLAAAVAADQAASAMSRMLFGPTRRSGSMPQAESIRLLTAGEGGGIPRVYGRARIGGQIIWTSNVREVTETIRSTRGAKGVKQASESEVTEYRYTVSLAIALCEGPIRRLGRVWADGRLIALKDLDYRLYPGTEDQPPDGLIEALEGAAPGYAGLAYVVIEDLDLSRFGNRIPQFNFEVVRPLRDDDPEMMENAVKAVTIIPGSGEFVYATTPVFDDNGEGITRAINMQNGMGIADAEASFDELQELFPGLEATSLVVSWFGDDLRAGECSVRPGAEQPTRMTEPQAWTVAGLTRAEARLLDRPDGRPSYGGTPSDASVREAITNLKERGLAVTFHPFLMMDIPPGNGLPDPYGGAEQASYPWRGRITSAADGSAAVRAEIDSFFDSYAVMIRHYAALCQELGGIERFLIGSELRGLTRLRDDTGAFPAVDRLRALAAEVKATLPSTEVTYGADWTEYGSHVPHGSDDLLYPLDPLWADPAIDCVGIDNYFPLTDWRDGPGHLDEALASGPYDPEYLETGIAGGEGYEWFYASDADRLAQVRTPISDGAYSEPWVFRPKDIVSWWSHTHTERIGGFKSQATPWVPRSKPIVFTEIGCPAIDKGPNQPNVFVDPKSSESAPPHFSTGIRDDGAQRAFLEAHHRYWGRPENNPVSDVYQGPMVLPNRMFVYAWDARPFPDFPARGQVWADAGNWTTGHWLNGRAGRIRLSDLVENIAREAGLAAVDASGCDALLGGYVLSSPGSGRDALEPLLDLFQLDPVVRGGVLRIRPRSGRPDAILDEGDLVDDGEGEPLVIEHAQADELPSALSITFTDELSGFTTRTVEVQDDTSVRGRPARIASPVVMEQGEAAARARAILAEARAMRSRISFGLPEAADGIEPGTVLSVHASDRALTIRVTTIEEDGFRALEGVLTDPGVFEAAYAGLRADPPPAPVAFGAPAFALLDIPLLPPGTSEAHLWTAGFADPWPGGLDLYRGADRFGSVPTLSLMGTLVAPLKAGPAARWDRAAVIDVRLAGGALESVTEGEVLGGAQLAAVETGSGWELLQFAWAELLPGGDWRLTGLLRGRFGTEGEAAMGAAAGARFVMLKGAAAHHLPSDLWGRTEILAAGPRGAVPGGYPFRPATAKLEGRGARPRAPVHLRARWHGGDLHLTWIRSTRIGGDRWDAGDVPLGESAERYRAQAFATDGTVLQSVVTDRPLAVFQAPSAARVTVAQHSALYGYGAEAELIL